jgi:outer membrane protein assembly factor BamB
MGSRATPWIDEDKVYTFGRSGDLICWNLFNGEKIWHKNVTNEGGEEHTWGHSSSPFVTDSLVIVNGGGTARTIAYNKFTGDVVWKSGTGLPGYAAISTIIIDGKQFILSFHGAGLSAINPVNGDEVWSHPWKTSYDVNATTPISYNDKVFITSGYGTGCVLLKVSLSGTEVLWTNETMSSHHSDPFIIDGYIYGYSGNSMQNKGDFVCIDLDTGEEKWSTGDMGWGTSVYVEGHILCSDIKGNLFLMKPDPNEFKLVTEMPNALGKISGAAWTIPVLANDKLYLRFKQKLISYNIKDGIKQNVDI